MSQQQRLIADWQGFVKSIVELDYDDLACRGEAQKYRHMKPKLDRLIDHAKRAHRLRVERDVCQRFREHAPVHLCDFEREYLETRWLQLVVMQHYGAPTRLVDWTKSPWVAAFFAVSSEAKKDGHIYIFRRTAMEAAIKSRFSKDLDDLVWGRRPKDSAISQDAWDYAKPNKVLFEDEPVKAFGNWTATFYSRLTHFPRLVAQQGLFTFASKPNLDHWALIRDQTAEDDRWDLTIGAGAKAGILRGLNITGINGATLFPGADGIGRSLDGFVQTRYLQETGVPRGQPG